MIEILKNLFGIKNKKEDLADPPGRTFKRIETGRYFGCENVNADENNVMNAKQRKIDQIIQLELIPMFIRYSHEDTNKRITQEEENKLTTEISSVHVTFQKEVFAEKWNMVHVTEISFIVNRSDFNEFEKISGVSLSDDFRDLTSTENATAFKGKERRKKKRDA